MCYDSNLGYGLLPLGSFSNLQNMINRKSGYLWRVAVKGSENQIKNKFQYFSMSWAFIFFINHRKCTLGEKYKGIFSMIYKENKGST